MTIKEIHIDRLVKLVLSEQRKKKNILPETWERAPAGKPKDPIGYWKALYDNLKKNGFPVKYEYPNDPAKSGYMYWGMWIISKDLKVNNGYPIYFYGSDKKYYHFKFKDGIYRGTSDLSQLKLSARFSSYTYPMNLSLFKKSQKEITDELNKDIKEKPGVSTVWSDLYSKLNQYKPSNVKLVKSDKGDAYFLTNYYANGVQLGFWQTGDVKLYDKTSWKSIGKWDPSMQKDGKLAGGWLKRNSGEKVSLGPALNEPNLMMMPFLLVSLWNNKSKTTPATPTKSKNYPYDELKNNPTPEFIAKVLIDSRGTVNDNEAWAEAAFMAIKNMDMYNKVASALKTDPYKFVRSFMNVSTKYHVQAIDVSYLNLRNNNIGPKVTKFSTQCKLTFTEENPGGGKTNKAGQVPYDLWNSNKDPLLWYETFAGMKRGRARVPEDFGWKLNNNIYPYPTLYSKECTTTTNINENKIYEQANFDRFKTTNQVKLNPNATTAAGVKQSQNRVNQKKMIEFNNALVQQNKLIPQYCTMPLRREKRVARGGNDPKIIDAYISMYTLCKDFGGLWVRGANTANYTCGCRDMNAVDLNLSVDDGSGYQNRMGKTISQNINKTQTSKNWSNADNQQLVVNVLALASAFIPVVGPVISAGISIGSAAAQYRKGNHKAAAVELLFACLPFIGKIPGLGKMSTNLARILKIKLVRGTPMTLTEFNALKNVVAYDTYVSTKVGQYLEKQAMSDVSKNLITTAVKKTEAKVVQMAGLPTYGDIKKKAVGETISTTTGAEDANNQKG